MLCDRHFFLPLGWGVEGGTGTAYGSGRSQVCLGDGPQQMCPVLKHHIDSDASQVLEEPVCGAAGYDGLPPGQDGKISGGVEGEGQQVERQKDAGQGLLAVAEIVLEVVAVGLE